MRLRRLELSEFRSYAHAEVELADGLTAILGPNGHGKTNLLEAVGWLCRLSSFRGAAAEALVRSGAERAVVRGEAEREGRELLIEAEISLAGRNRVQLNRQRVHRARDLAGALQAVVFAPDDLVLVKGGPAERRGFLDETLAAISAKHDAQRGDVDRILRQRNALLRQTGGRPDSDALLTLDVWDAQLASVGEAVARRRLALLERLVPLIGAAYDALAREEADITAVYEAPWLESGLAAALVAGRRDDLRRGVSTVGPHRDELVLRVGPLSSRSQASQGEQRSLALALRLAAHRLITEHTGSAPLLLLDDVFSELDPARSAALVAALPAAQTLLTSAVGPPEGAVPERILCVRQGVVCAR
ncbi:MAG: DNA replication/repair protein RecF [Acidimicrobiales bacterium]